MRAKRSIIPVFVPHAGCPNDCVFCNQRSISGSLSAPTAKELAAQITKALELIPGKENIQLAFYGGSFTAIPLDEQVSLLEGALPFLNSGAIKSLRLSTRPDCIDEAVLSLLKKYGVETIELGAQSMDEGVLALSGRGHTAEDTVRASRLIKNSGFELILQMMTGLPGDTKEKSLQTAKEIIALHPNGVRIYPTVIIRDTPLYDMWRAGLYREHTVDEAVDWCADICALFDEAEIPVIRLGLNPSDELSGGSAAGGAYHPALGELVRSKQLFCKAKTLLERAALGEKVALGVNKSEISAMVGQGRENIRKLEELFGISSIKVRSAELKKGEVIIL